MRKKKTREGETAGERALRVVGRWLQALLRSEERSSSRAAAGGLDDRGGLRLIERSKRAAAGRSPGRTACRSKGVSRAPGCAACRTAGWSSHACPACREPAATGRGERSARIAA